MKLNQTQLGRLRDLLDGRLASLGTSLRLHAEKEDPVGLVYPYAHSPHDAEVVALIASSLAYGQRKVFIPVVSKILQEMGSSPYDFVMSGGYKRSFDWFCYRFNKPEDLRCLLFSVQHVLQVFGSLESVLVADACPTAPSLTKTQLTSFVRTLRTLDFSGCGAPSGGSAGFAYLLPNPAAGGACKRLNMLMRWMFRKDEVDLGLWSGISLDKLIVPLDTHVRRVSFKLGLTARSGSTWRCAEDITHSLLQLDSRDPLKYDFLLFSMGAWDEL